MQNKTMKKVEANKPTMAKGGMAKKGYAKGGMAKKPTPCKAGASYKG
jgi:hypothetical protein